MQHLLPQETQDSPDPAGPLELPDYLLKGTINAFVVSTINRAPTFQDLPLFRVGESQFRSQARGRRVRSTPGPSVPQGWRAAAYQVRGRTATDVPRLLRSFAA